MLSGMGAPIITASDDIVVTAYLSSGGSDVNCSASTIKAALQNGKGSTLIAGTAQSSATTGAAWATGVVVVVFPRTITAGLCVGDAYLEIEETTSAGIRRTYPLVALEVQVGVI